MPNPKTIEIQQYPAYDIRKNADENMFRFSWVNNTYYFPSRLLDLHLKQVFRPACVVVGIVCTGNFLQSYGLTTLSYMAVKDVVNFTKSAFYKHHIKRVYLLTDVESVVRHTACNSHVHFF